MAFDFPLTDPALDHLQDGRGYYGATAPDGTMLHGSSALKLYRSDPLGYSRWITAHQVVWLCKSGLGTRELRIAAEKTIEGYQRTVHQNFGNIVDSYLYRQHEEVRKYEQKESTRTLLRARRRVAALRSHPDVGPYVTSPTLVPQVAHAWQDEATGLWLRMRMDSVDYIDARPSYLDLKVWSRSHPKMVRRNIEDFGVDIQMPLYRRGAMHLWGAGIRCGIVVCDPKDNGPIYLRWFDDGLVDEWDEELGGLLDRLAASYRTGDFRNPDEGVAVLGREVSG